MHYKMAEMYDNGRLGPEPDLKRAVFHMERAAELGDVQANVCLAKVYAGVSRDVLREHIVEEDVGTAFKYWLAAAKGGDLEAMNTVANYYDGTFSSPAVATSYREAASWYEALVRRHEELDESADLAEDEFELHCILAKLAGLYEVGGFDLRRSARRALALYSQAAEAAEDHMKSKLAAKYYEKVALVGMVVVAVAFAQHQHYNYDYYHQYYYLHYYYYGYG